MDACLLVEWRTDNSHLFPVPLGADNVVDAGSQLPVHLSDSPTLDRVG